MNKSDDLISRQVAIDALNNEIIKRRLLDDVNDGMLDEFNTEAILRRLPSAQPERKTGKWIDDNIFGQLPVIICDQCKTFFPLQFGDSHNFCPNCGADMRGGGKNERRRGKTEGLKFAMLQNTR